MLRALERIGLLCPSSCSITCGRCLGFTGTGNLKLRIRVRVATTGTGSLPLPVADSDVTRIPHKCKINIQTT